MSRIPRTLPAERFRAVGITGVKTEATRNRPVRAPSGQLLLNADAIGGDDSGKATLLTAIDSVGKTSWRVRIPHLAGVAIAGEPAVLPDERVRFVCFQHKVGFQTFLVRDGSVEEKIAHAWPEWPGPKGFEAEGDRSTNESPVAVAPTFLLDDGDALVSWRAWEKSVTMRVAPDGEVRWKKDGFCAGVAGPVAPCVEGDVCVARDLATGEERWRTEGPVHAIHRDRVIAGAVRSIDAATGEAVFTMPVVNGAYSVVRAVASDAGTAITLLEPQSTPRIALVDPKGNVRHFAIPSGEGPNGTVWGMDSAFFLYSVMKSRDEWELVCAPIASPGERAWSMPWPRAGARVWGRYALVVADEWILVRHGAFVLAYAPP